MLSNPGHPLLNPNQALIDLVTAKAYGPEGTTSNPPEAFTEPDSPDVARSLLARMVMQDSLSPPNTLMIDHQIHVVTDNRSTGPKTDSHDVYQVSTTGGNRSTTWAVNKTTDVARTQHVDARGNKTSGNLRMTDVHAAIGYFLQYGHVVEPAPQEQRQPDPVEMVVAAPQVPAWRRVLGLGRKK